MVPPPEDEEESVIGSPTFSIKIKHNDVPVFEIEHPYPKKYKSKVIETDHEKDSDSSWWWEEEEEVKEGEKYSAHSDDNFPYFPPEKILRAPNIVHYKDDEFEFDRHEEEEFYHSGPGPRSPELGPAPVRPYQKISYVVPVVHHGFEEEPDCCPVVADPFMVLGLFGLIFFSAVFLNVAITMNLGRRRKKRHQASSEFGMGDLIGRGKRRRERMTC